MIKIIDDWYVTVETNPVNYVVRRGKGEKDVKNSWRDKPYGYFGSLKKAIKFIRDQIIAERFSEASRTLPEAFRTITETDERFEKIMERVTV